MRLGLFVGESDGLVLVSLMEMCLAVVLDHAWEKMMVGMMV
jgi:hypothetical protein